MKESNGLENIISQALEEMKTEQGNAFSLERINLAELERRTGISRARLRRLKANNFSQKPHGLVGQKQMSTVLSGYSSYLDSLLSQGITNSVVCLNRLQAIGFEGSLSTVKRYIRAHKHLVPAKRQLVVPHRVTEADASLQSREKPTKWTGASLKFWTMMEQNTPPLVLLWFAITADSGMLNSSPMPNKRIYLLE